MWCDGGNRHPLHTERIGHAEIPSEVAAMTCAHRGRCPGRWVATRRELNSPPSRSRREETRKGKENERACRRHSERERTVPPKLHSTTTHVTQFAHDR